METLLYLSPIRRRLRRPSVWLAAAVLLVSGARAQGPMAAKVTVTQLAGYSGGTSLTKPDKILVYDFAVNADDVQVDKVQSIRPRHLLRGDESPEAIAAGATKKFSEELVKALEKTGIPVEHVAAGHTPSTNQLAIQGSFTSLKQGSKTERETVGMGAGGADVQTKVDVHLKTPAETVLLSQFQTETTAAQNPGAAVPVAAGMNPASAVAKSTVGDRKKTVDAYTSKTADATAKEILKSMAAQGWIKTNDKSEVASAK